LELREFLFWLMKQSTKSFEASVGQISDSETRSWFYKIWPAQVQMHVNAKK